MSNPNTNYKNTIIVKVENAVTSTSAKAGLLATYWYAMRVLDSLS